MNKESLSGSIRVMANNIRMVHVFLLITSKNASNPDKLLPLKNMTAGFGLFNIEDLMSDPRLFVHSMNQLSNTVYKAAFIDSFELTKQYCKESDQLEIFQSQTWYQFGRIIRNCLSHNFKFEFNDYDRKKLPVSWGRVIIDESMHGKDLNKNHFSEEKIWSFINEISEFIDTELA